MNVTHTYAILDVSAKTFADVCTRLKGAGRLNEYLQEGERPLIVFGTVALREEEGLEPVHLLDVPVHDLNAPEAVKRLLHLSPWERTSGAARTVQGEILGILAGHSLALGFLDNAVNLTGDAEKGLAVEMKPLTYEQFAAEIKNLILLCGGKV